MGCLAGGVITETIFWVVVDSFPLIVDILVVQLVVNFGFCGGTIFEIEHDVVCGFFGFSGGGIFFELVHDEVSGFGVYAGF